MKTQNDLVVSIILVSVILIMDGLTEDEMMRNLKLGVICLDTPDDCDCTAGVDHVYVYLFVCYSRQCSNSILYYIYRI